MTVTQSLAKAGKAALKAAGIDIDLAAKRERLRKILADKANRVEAQKAQGRIVQETRGKVATGELHPGRIVFEESKYQQLTAAVEACKRAETQLKEGAPADVIFEFRTVGRDYHKCTADIQRLEREASDASGYAAEREAELNQLRAHTPTTYPGDAWSTKSSADEHQKRCEYAASRHVEAQRAHRQLEIELADAKRRLPEISERLADARRRLIES